MRGVRSRQRTTARQKTSDAKTPSFNMSEPPLAVSVMVADQAVYSRAHDLDLQSDVVGFLHAGDRERSLDRAPMSCSRPSRETTADNSPVSFRKCPRRSAACRGQYYRHDSGGAKEQSLSKHATRSFTTGLRPGALVDPWSSKTTRERSRVPMRRRPSCRDASRKRLAFLAVLGRRHCGRPRAGRQLRMARRSTILNRIYGRRAERCESRQAFSSR